ncbi:MAG: YfhO family protein, partial [Muribaculaceae bacterium]|nr:YfhO family protein [Muribaculaceae bacterium]
GVLDTINPGRYAVADKTFEKVLGKANPVLPGDTIYETSYAPNKLTYKARSAKGNLAVFSEIFFPWGWQATIDGNPAPIGRVDYVLRAMQIPAGTHDIVMVFDPQSIRTTNTIAMVSVIAIYALCLIAFILAMIRLFTGRKEPDKKQTL